MNSVKEIEVNFDFVFIYIKVSLRVVGDGNNKRNQVQEGAGVIFTIIIFFIYEAWEAKNQDKLRETVRSQVWIH